MVELAPGICHMCGSSQTNALITPNLNKLKQTSEQYSEEYLTAWFI